MEDLTIAARTVNQLAYERLSALILAGVLGPGERLDERLLAARMGVSRTPLREAIGQLANDGIVEHRPYQGNFVRSFTPKQVHDLYDVRIALESLAVRIASETLGEAGIAELEQSVAACRRALDAGDLEEFEQTDRDFHEIIVRYADNESLTVSLRRLGLHVQLIRHLANHEPGLPEHTMTERIEILDALREHEVERAVAGMVSHIQDVQAAVVARLTATT